MTQELLPQGSTGLARPVEVVPKAVADYALAVVEQVAKLPAAITNAAEFKRAGELLNEATKTFNSIDKTRLELARQYDAKRDADVNTPAKLYLTPLKSAKERLQPMMEAWDRLEREELAWVALEKEQQRLKAEQLRLEAETRQAKAADAVEAAATPEEFAAAATAFDQGVQKDAEALDMTLASLAAPLPELTKAKGTKDKMEVRNLEVTDLSALPLTYHLPDLKKIEKHILDKTLTAATPGIKFVLGKKFSATGR